MSDAGTSRVLAVGDKIRRTLDSRRFEITFLNHRSPTPVFTAKSDDGEWADWGGPMSGLVYGKTFVLAGEPFTESEENRMLYYPVCPECRVGKHGNCDGTSWSNLIDKQVACNCRHLLRSAEPTSGFTVVSAEDYLPAEVTAGMMAGLVDLDGELVGCPRCGNQLRSEVRTVWRSLSDASEVMEFEVTAAMVRESGGKLDSFGRVKCAVPYVSCMHCGYDADASKRAFIEPADPPPVRAALLMGYRVECGYVRDGIETLTDVWVHPGEPRLGTYDKTTPVEQTNDAAKYSELGITHLIEHVTTLETP